MSCAVSTWVDVREASLFPLRSLLPLDSPELPSSLQRAVQDRGRGVGGHVSGSATASLPRMLLPLGGTPGAVGEGSRGKLLGLAGLHPRLLSLALTNSM